MDDSSYAPGLLGRLTEKYVRTSDHHLPMGIAPLTLLFLLPFHHLLFPFHLLFCHEPQTLKSLSPLTPANLISNHPSSGWLCSGCADLSVPWTHPTCSHLRTSAQAGKLSPQIFRLFLKFQVLGNGNSLGTFSKHPSKARWTLLFQDNQLVLPLWFFFFFF